jgi:hypothetical protein
MKRENPNCKPEFNWCDALARDPCRAVTLRCHLKVDTTTTNELLNKQDQRAETYSGTDKAPNSRVTGTSEARTRGACHESTAEVTKAEGVRSHRSGACYTFTK